MRTFTRPTGRRTYAAVVGDRVGLLLLLGSLLFFGLTWRVGVFVSDTYTVANTAVAVADGHLHVEEVVYGPTSVGPRMHVVDGRIYGRNYGQVVLSLPLLWALTAVSRVVDLGVALALGWSLVLFGFAVTLGRSRDRARPAALVGVFLAIALFAANVALAEPVDPRWIPLLALQLSTMLAAAFVGVFVYRLLARAHGRRVGAFAGAGAVLCTPVGFWATIPKRHTLVALFAVLALYCFYRSREAADLRTSTRFRALAYVPVGLSTWVLAPEGLVLFLALGVVDLLTARSNDPRRLVVVGGVFVASMMPALATNLLVSGHPFRPPIALPAYDGTTGVEAGGTAAGDTAASGSAAGSTAAGEAAGGSTAASPADGLVTVGELLARFLGEVHRGVQALFDPHYLVHVFVRGNLGLGLAKFDSTPVNLSVLEAMPLAAAVLSVSILVARRVREGRIRPTGVREGRVQPTIVRAVLRDDPRRATDLLALAYLFLLVLIYLPRSLTYVMLTVRYLHPLFPICVYLLARLAVVRSTVDREGRLLAGAYAAFLLVGGPLFVLVLASFAGGLGEAVQLHARVALAGAAVVLYWSVIATLLDGYERLGAVAMGFAGAVTTTYLLLSAVVYFEYGSYALPVVRLLAEPSLW